MTPPDFYRILCSHPSPMEIGVNTLYYIPMGTLHPHPSPMKMV
jgi:hypothetical protein